MASAERLPVIRRSDLWLGATCPMVPSALKVSLFDGDFSPVPRPASFGTVADVVNDAPTRPANSIFPAWLVGASCPETVGNASSTFVAAITPFRNFQGPIALAEVE